MIKKQNNNNKKPMILEFLGDIKLALVNVINFVLAIKEYTDIKSKNNMSELLNCFFPGGY